MLRPKEGANWGRRKKKKGKKVNRPQWVKKLPLKRTTLVGEKGGESKGVPIE